jgi:PAS domain S-box-containing protein
MLSFVAEHGGVDATTYTTANDWMGLGFSLLVVASMHMMREVFTRQRLAAESLRMLTATSNDAIIAMDNKGVIIVWNQAAQTIFGYGKAEAEGKKFKDLAVPERYRSDFEKMFVQFGADGRESLSSKPTEQAGLRQDGMEIATEYSMSRVSIDGKWHAICIVRDITARQQAEVQIRERTSALEMLSAKMLRSDELEKKNLAYGLHEGLAQTLALIKLRVERNLEAYPANSAPDESQVSTVALLQSVINDVEAIATALRPSSLDEIGLLRTINWFCREFDRLHPAIQILEEITVQENDVPEPLKIVIYRIIESAFANIARYENADQIALALQRKGGEITMAIEDTSHDTRYAATAERRQADLQTRFGEAQERTKLSGGNFKIARGNAGRITLRASWAV